MSIIKNFNEFTNEFTNITNENVIKMESIKSKLNIIDAIKREDIEDSAPVDSEYGMLNPSGDFIQKFYRFKNVKYNDGTNKDILNYWGEQGGWHPSSYNSNDVNKLQDIKFLEII